jgi:hypothetical protein
VNVRDEIQRVTLQAPGFVSGWVYSLHAEDAVKVFGTGVIVKLEDYKVLRLVPDQGSKKGAGTSPGLK